MRPSPPHRLTKGVTLLVYIEYISRREGVSLEEFHYAAGLQDMWTEDHDEDVLLLNMGRTFRTGPDPWYLAAWYTPDGGIERIGDWERTFAAHEADALEVPFKLGAQIETAGCYEPLLEPIPLRGGLYYAEYFDLSPGATRDDARAHFEERRDRHSGIELGLVCDRIGHLGPDPRGLAVWDAGGWNNLDSIVRELEGVEEPIRLVAAGLYRDLGDETL